MTTALFDKWIEGAPRDRVADVACRTLKTRLAAVQHYLPLAAERADEAALQQFRIRGKELRYALELLAGALPERARTELYPAVEEMQDRLGEINDPATAKERLRHKIEGARGRPETAPWRRLLANEQGRLDRARQGFWEWCAAHLLQDLRAGLDTVLTPPGPAPPLWNGWPPPQDVDPPAMLPPAKAPAAAGRINGSPGPLTKARIVGELGEQELLFPALVNAALAANDRAKYLMTLLQAAREHGDHPDAQAARLGQERLACGVADANLDNVVEGSRKEGADDYHIPLASSIHDALVGEARRVLAPLVVSPGPAASDGPDRPGVAHEKHLQALLAEAPALAEDHISGPYIDRLTRSQRGAGDSLHLLVMDLHKELNQLQGRLTARGDERRTRPSSPGSSTRSASLVAGTWSSRGKARPAGSGTC